MRKNGARATTLNYLRRASIRGTGCGSSLLTAGVEGVTFNLEIEAVLFANIRPL